MTLNGLLLVDKPVGCTSYDVVRWVRKQCPVGTKVGHLGTLDPFASGLLPILLGSATRLSSFFLHGTKQYYFCVSLGVATDTLDCMGQIQQQAPVSAGWQSQLSQLKNLFLGAIDQVPPAYSALKYNGRPLYEYMRTQGQLPFDLMDKMRTVHVHTLDFILSDQNDDQTHHTPECFWVRVVCGGGTYVRSLARDMALALGTVGHCSQLRREAVGEWSVKAALSFHDLKMAQSDWRSHVIRSDVMVKNLPHFYVSLDCITPFSHGQALTYPLSADDQQKLLTYGFSSPQVVVEGVSTLAFNECRYVPSGMAQPAVDLVPSFSFVCTLQFLPEANGVRLAPKLRLV